MNEESVIVIDREEERKKRGALAVILALVFIALLGVGSTFAYLTWTANQTPNRETMGSLTADMLEPAYSNTAITDNGGTVGTKMTYSADKVKYVASDGKLIPKGASNMIPSSEYMQNPFVVNTSKSENAYGFAGLKIQFQKWQKTANGDKATNTNDANWVNMTGDEVSHLLAVYSISSDANSATAGFTIAKASNKWKSDAVNTTTEATKAGTDAGATANKWVQLTGTTYGATTVGTASTTGAMYFVNYGRLTSMNNSSATDNAIAKALANTEKTNMGKTTWGYKADDVDNASSTSPLFQYVRLIDTASQENIDTLMKDLDPSTVTVTGTNTFTPAWRMVVSAAIIQSTSVNDLSGSNNTAIAKVDQPLFKSTTYNSANLNQSSTWYTQFKTVLDKSGGTTDVNRNEKTKPLKATGVREASTLGEYYTLSGTTLTQVPGTGVSEPTSIG